MVHSPRLGSQYVSLETFWQRSPGQQPLPSSPHVVQVPFMQPQVGAAAHTDPWSPPTMQHPPARHTSPWQQGSPSWPQRIVHEYIVMEALASGAFASAASATHADKAGRHSRKAQQG
jgi:hypothetical protein